MKLTAITLRVRQLVAGVVAAEQVEAAVEQVAAGGQRDGRQQHGARQCRAAMSPAPRPSRRCAHSAPAARPPARRTRRSATRLTQGHQAAGPAAPCRARAAPRRDVRVRAWRRELIAPGLAPSAQAGCRRRPWRAQARHVARQPGRPAPDSSRSEVEGEEAAHQRASRCSSPSVLAAAPACSCGASGARAARDSCWLKARSRMTTLASRLSDRLSGSRLLEPTVAHSSSTSATLPCSGRSQYS